jgi:capsular exopolysaccharide synthesis family protein
MAGLQASTLADYLAILQRRKLIVLLALVLVPVVALLVSATQDPLHESRAEVLLSRQSLANTLAGTTDPTVFQDADRVVQTQAKLAEVPAVAARTVAAVPEAGLTADELLQASNVQPEPNVDLLEFSVRHEDPELASRLATAYAREYTRYRAGIETRALVDARQDVQVRIRELRDAGSSGPLLDDLLSKEQQLLTLETLQGGNASLVRPAGEAEKLQPKPLRNLALGLVLGLGLGLLLAFLAEALDTRIRSVDEVVDRLGLTLLGRLPPPAAELRGTRAPEILVERDSPAAEAFRMLRTNIDFANLDVRAKSILITSAIEGEGKSTTAANLAAAFAIAGRSVILVDLDLRRPTLHKFFGLKRTAGVTDVVLGQASVETALSRTGVAGLRVLQAGGSPPNPGEFVGTQALREVLEEVAEHAEIVLVDCPPMLQVGDAMTLSSSVDAVLILTRLRTVDRQALADLRRSLEQMPAPVLGLVVTDVKDGVGYGYGSDRPRKRGLGATWLQWTGQPAPASLQPKRERRTRVRSL